MSNSDMRIIKFENFGEIFNITLPRAVGGEDGAVV
jgi:hypothetical protein